MQKKVVILFTVLSLLFLTSCTYWNTARNYNPFPAAEATVPRGIQLYPVGSIFQQKELIPGFDYTYCVEVRNYNPDPVELVLSFRDGDADNKNGGIIESQSIITQEIPGTNLDEKDYGDTSAVQKEVNDNTQRICPGRSFSYTNIQDPEKIVYFQALAQYDFELHAEKAVCIPGRIESQGLCRNDASLDTGNNQIAPVAIQNLHIEFSPDPTGTGSYTSTLTFDLVDMEGSLGYVPNLAENNAPTPIDINVVLDRTPYLCKSIDKKTGEADTHFFLTDNSVTIQCAMQGQVPFDDSGDSQETVTRFLSIDASYPYVITTKSASIKVARGMNQ